MSAFLSVLAYPDDQLRSNAQPGLLLDEQFPMRSKGSKSDEEEHKSQGIGLPDGLETDTVIVVGRREPGDLVERLYFGRLTRWR